MNSGQGNNNLQRALVLMRAGIDDALGESVDDALIATAEAYRFQQQVIAELLRAAATITARVKDTYPQEILEHVVADQLAGDMLAQQTGVSCRYGQHLTAYGEDTLARLKPAWKAMRRGELDFARFKTLDRISAVLDNDKTQLVQDEVLAGAAKKSARAFRDHVSRAVRRADPEAAAKRVQRVRARRGVEFWLTDDGEAVLQFRGPVQLLRPAYNCLFHDAKKHPDRARTLDNKAFDIGIDKLGRNALGLPRTHTMVNVTVALKTLLGLDNEDGHLDGGGPLSAQTVRDIAGDERSYLRRIVTDEHDEIVGITDKYRLTPKQRAKAHLRQRTCVVPGCNHPASSGDLDHGNPYRATGITDLDDIAALCRRHHIMKHLGILRWKRHTDGEVEFGYHTRAEDFPDEPASRPPRYRHRPKPPQPIPVTDDEECPF